MNTPYVCFFGYVMGWYTIIYFYQSVNNLSYFSFTTHGHFLSHVHHHVHIALTVDFKKIYILSYHKEHCLAITVVKDRISKMNL